METISDKIGKAYEFISDGKFNNAIELFSETFNDTLSLNHEKEKQDNYRGIELELLKEDLSDKLQKAHDYITLGEINNAIELFESKQDNN